VVLVFHFFALFGSFIEIWLNQDSLVQWASTSFTEVSKWLSSFYKAIFLWAMIFRRPNSERLVFLLLVVGFSMTLQDSTGRISVCDKSYLSRSEVDNAFPLVLQLFVFSILRYSQIDLMDQKSHMEILINKLFSWMFKLRHCKILLVQRIVLNRCL
jgi:hypothetical protein